jgi:hypothetical protein
MTLLITLAALIVYLFIGSRLLLPFFTEFQVRRIFYKFPRQTVLDSNDQKDVLWFSTLQATIWPLALMYVAAWNVSGVLGRQGDSRTAKERRQAVIDARIARRHSNSRKSYEQLLKENERLARELDLEIEP